MLPMPKPSTLRKTPLLALASIRRISSSSSGDADVEIAVGGQDDAVGAVLDEVLGGDVVGELNARAAVGRAAGAQLVDGREDLRLVDARRRGQHQPRCAGVDDDGDLVVLAELLDQPLEAPLHQRQLVGLVASSRRRRPGRRGCWAAAAPGRWAWRRCRCGRAGAGRSTGSRRPRHAPRTDARSLSRAARRDRGSN